VRVRLELQRLSRHAVVLPDGLVDDAVVYHTGERRIGGRIGDDAPSVCSSAVRLVMTM